MIAVTTKTHENEITDKNERIIHNIRDISRTMLELYEGKSSQKRVLILIREMGEITQRELTLRMGIKPASVSELLTKLENNGMIVRRPSKADRRMLILSLTNTGEAVAIHYGEQREKRHDEMFRCLSDGEQDTLIALLEKINADWNEKYR